MTFNFGPVRAGQYPKISVLPNYDPTNDIPFGLTLLKKPNLKNNNFKIQY